MNFHWRKAAVWLATGGGLGYSPVASGTAGTLPGILIVALLWPQGTGYPALPDLALQVVAALVLAVLAVPLCDIAEAHFKKKDDGHIVADEFMTFPICMLGLPLTPWVVAMAFVSNRVFDILKPPPARGLQALPGGFGIVIDDVFATLYSLAANHLAYWLIVRYLVS